MPQALANARARSKPGEIKFQKFIEISRVQIFSCDFFLPLFALSVSLSLPAPLYLSRWDWCA